MGWVGLHCSAQVVGSVSLCVFGSINGAAESLAIAIGRRTTYSAVKSAKMISSTRIYYFSSDDWSYPLGHIQMIGKSDGVQIRGDGMHELLDWFPEMPFDWIAAHSLDFWLTSEDLPSPENRVYYDQGRVVLDLTLTNMVGHRRLRQKLRELCGKLEIHPRLFDRSLYLGQNIPIGGTAHQAGTLRFGTDPALSVLDVNCKAHEVDNLYVTDGSFFPSVGAVNPTLTIIANSLRVGDHIAERLKV